MRQSLLISFIIAGILCAFLAGIAVAELKPSLYYKFRALIYTVLSIDQRADRNALYYQEKLSLFENDKRQDYEVVFIGDSITDGADWQSFFPHRAIANRGINGDTSKGILKRISNIKNTGAKLAFIMIGVNDLHQGFDVNEIVNNYQKIIEQLLLADMTIVVQSTLLTRSDNEAINANINAMNSHLSLIAGQRSEISFIDINQNLASDGQLKADYTYDGIHLNGIAYQRWSRAIAPILD